METSELIFNESEIYETALKVLEDAGNKKIWFFKGEMGVGKTTFIKEICKILGTSSEMSSPTFSIVNEYLLNDNSKIFHFDLYRIKKLQELNEIGIMDYLDSGNYCFIEWPEILPEIENVLNLEIRLENENRVLIIK